MDLEWQNILEYIKDISAQETLSEIEINQIIYYLSIIQKEINLISDEINMSRKIQRLQKRAGDIQIEEFLKSSLNRSSIKTMEQYAAALSATEHLNEMRSNQEIKQKMIQAKQIIMALRALTDKVQIEYKLFIYGINKENHDVILMGNQSLDNIIHQSNSKVTLNNNLDILLSYTTEEAQQIIDSYDEENTIMGQWRNILTPEREPAWEVLKQVRQQLRSKVYINYGELLESLIDLENWSMDIEHMADDIEKVFNALKSGLNTAPFEARGDFEFEGIDVQSKLVSAFGPDSLSHRIRYLSISNIKRVINNLLNAFNIIRSNPEQLKTELNKVFESTSTITKLKQEQETIVKDTIAKVLKEMYKQVNNNSS